MHNFLAKPLGQFLCLDHFSGLNLIKATTREQKTTKIMAVKNTGFYAVPISSCYSTKPNFLLFT